MYLLLIISVIPFPLFSLFHFGHSLGWSTREADVYKLPLPCKIALKVLRLKLGLLWKAVIHRPMTLIEKKKNKLINVLVCSYKRKTNWSTEHVLVVADWWLPLADWWLSTTFRCEVNNLQWRIICIVWIWLSNKSETAPYAESKTNSPWRPIANSLYFKGEMVW